MGGAKARPDKSSRVLSAIMMLLPLLDGDGLVGLKEAVKEAMASILP